MTIQGSAGGGSGKARRIRLGMVGGGPGAFIGAVHRIAARLDDRYELVAGALSSDPQRARTGAQELLIDEDRCYADFREMARREAARPDGIDVVSIVTPNHLHYPIARTFVEAGIHVICDKPLTTNLDDARSLVGLVRDKGVLFALTHNYTGYPLVRLAREMVQAGELGELRVIQAEYVQDWLTTRLEDTGQKQAAWRCDPAQAGAGGALGDIGTHAHNLAAFISGLELSEVSADIGAMVPGRKLDDNVHVMLRYTGGAKGMLWASQVAPGNENGLKVRIFGTKAGLEFRQENPNELRFMPLGGVPQTLTRGGSRASTSPGAGRATRIPPGHPEGYLEGFAQLYTDFAEQLAARLASRKPDPLACLVPTVEDGARGMAFISAVVESSRANGKWVDARVAL
ncbi:MAG TPA: Gfo/Idh/MocA family oxidoreductase [Burkholderiaceae bacterium]|nr:Gfo/Idh/MocA family oxidoreductase [Burkholderiaceae bacterium]